MSKRIKGKECIVTVELEGETIEISSELTRAPHLGIPGSYSFTMDARIICSGRWHRSINIHGHQTQLVKECLAFDETLSDDIRRRLKLPPYERYEFNLRSWFLRWS